METELLKRNTTWPVQEFVILPLEPDTADAIIKAIMPHGRLACRVLHVQIAKQGRLTFAAYDAFAPDCVTASTDVPEHLLAELAAAGTIRSFMVMSS